MIHTRHEAQGLRRRAEIADVHWSEPLLFTASCITGKFPFHIVHFSNDEVLSRKSIFWNVFINVYLLEKYTNVYWYRYGTEDLSIISLPYSTLQEFGNSYNKLAILHEACAGEGVVSAIAFPPEYKTRRFFTSSVFSSAWELANGFLVQEGKRRKRERDRERESEWKKDERADMSRPAAALAQSTDRVARGKEFFWFWTILIARDRYF
jgi:hypothetical protein